MTLLERKKIKSNQLQKSNFKQNPNIQKPLYPQHCPLSHLSHTQAVLLVSFRNQISTINIEKSSKSKVSLKRRPTRT